MTTGDCDRTVVGRFDDVSRLVAGFSAPLDSVVFVSGENDISLGLLGVAEVSIMSFSFAISVGSSAAFVSSSACHFVACIL